MQIQRAPSASPDLGVEYVDGLEKVGGLIEDQEVRGSKSIP